MKVIVNYDQATGEISDKNGAFITNWLALKFEPVQESSADTTDTNQLIKLKDAGFSVEEIINLRDRGLI